MTVLCWKIGIYTKKILGKELLFHVTQKNRQKKDILYNYYSNIIIDTKIYLQNIHMCEISELITNNVRQKSDCNIVFVPPGLETSKKIFFFFENDAIYMKKL